MLRPETDPCSSVVGIDCRFMRPAMDFCAATDDSPRVKFLCSFGGSILPRPLDGRLRYVGGETRIVTVPRDASYEDLLARVREIFDGVSVIKYQQPDEDLDALVSVVNDEDVTNMMEEYDKVIACGDGQTWLRIFLFSQYPDQDVATVGAHLDADEREAERRYIDAINSLVDAKSSSPPDISEHCFGSVSIDGGINSHVNLRQLTIPSRTQRFADMDTPRSPVLFSPGPHAANDPPEFPPSPSSARFHIGTVEFSDRLQDEYVRQAVGQPLHLDHQPQPSMESLMWMPTGTVGHDKSGFPTNLVHSHNMIEGNNVCENCQMAAFHRNHGIMPDARFHDARWKHGQPYTEQPNMVNEYVGHYPNASAECFGNRDPCMVNRDVKVAHGIYVKEQNEQHLMYSDSHGYERGWAMHSHQVNHRLDDMRIHHNGNGRVNEHYIIDGNTMNASFVTVNEEQSFPSSRVSHNDAQYIRQGATIGNEVFLPQHTVGNGRVNEHYIIEGNTMNASFVTVNEEQSFPSSRVSHNDAQYIRHGANIGNEVFLPQHTVGTVPGTNVSGFEDTAIRYWNQPSAYGAESLYQCSNNLHPTQPLWRNRHVPTHPGTSYELPSAVMPNSVPDSAPVRYTHEGNPRISYVRIEEEHPNTLSMHNNTMSHRMLGYEESAASDYNYHFGTRLNRNVACLDGRMAPLVPGSQAILHRVPSEPVALVSTPLCLIDNELVDPCVNEANQPPILASDRTRQMQDVAEKNLTVVVQEREHEVSKEPDSDIIFSANSRKHEEYDPKGLQPSDAEENAVKCVDVDTNDAHGEGDMSENLTFLPELIASVTKAVLEGAEEVVAMAQSVSELDVSSATPSKKESLCGYVAENTNAGVQANMEGNSEQEKLCKIEPMTAEAGDLDKGLQTTNVGVQVNLEGNSDLGKLCKIEPTTAEADALAKGLQTIKHDDLEEIRELGSGTFGSVYYGKWRGSDVAIKRIKASCFAGKPSERERLLVQVRSQWHQVLRIIIVSPFLGQAHYLSVQIADFWKEALLMSCLHHPNIVSFYGVVRDRPDDCLATVTEFMVNGSLKQFLQKKDRTIDRRKRLIIAMDVAFGMEYLHAKNIVHFDLKCENLLVNMRDPQRPVCKIGDLGLSKVKQQTLVSGGLRGTLPWMAPELLSGKSNMVSEKIDVYSYGIVMWELLTGEEPYADMRCASIIGGIVNNTIRPKIPSWCDPEWKSLMESCWSSDPTLRPSFSEISQKLRKMAAAINLK